MPEEPADQGSPGREVEERSPEEPKRPAGVQPSRKTHRPGGFYAGFLTAQDRQDLSAAVSIGLEDEIAILKVSLRKLLAMFDDVENLREAVALSSQIGATAARIGQLEKVQHSLYDRTRTASDAVSLALSEVMQELKIHI